VLAALLGAGCGNGDAACDAYPIAYTGALTGAVDGESFTATFQVSRLVGGIDGTWFNGQFTGTGASVDVFGDINFTVECASGNLVEQKGWNVDTSVADYPRGEVTGNVQASGGFGNWTCTSNCEGSGTFTATPL